MRDIYEAGIATGNATFETAAPSWERWDAGHLADHRLVATDDDDVVVGWAALSPVSDRCVYAGVAENSVYIHPDHRGRGVGTDLLDALVVRRGARRLLDGPDRHLPGEHRQHRHPRARRVPRSSAAASASVSSTGCGATRCSSNVAAPASERRARDDRLVHRPRRTAAVRAVMDTGRRAAGGRRDPPRRRRALRPLQHVAERLTAAGYRVDAFDQRSHGRSERVRGVALQCDDAAHLVADTAAWLDQRSGALPLFVIGHSMGGLVATALAVDGRLDVAGLIVLGPGAADHTRRGDGPGRRGGRRPSRTGSSSRWAAAGSTRPAATRR